MTATKMHNSTAGYNHVTDIFPTLINHVYCSKILNIIRIKSFKVIRSNKTLKVVKVVL